MDTSPSLTRVADLFVRMWAVAHVIHLAGATSSRLDTPWNVLVVVAALVLVLRPRSRRWLVVMGAAQLVDMVVEMPLTPDHWIMVGAANLVILVSLWVRRGDPPAALPAAFPALRVVFLVAYGAAAIAKYNTTFLDPVLSCATAIANRASYGLAGQLDVDLLWPVASIVLETAIPILLVIPATRRHGVRIGMGFHFVLSASPVFAVIDYTAALFTLFLLFLPLDEVERMLDRLVSVADRSAIVRDARRVPPVTTAVAFLALGFLGYLSLQVAGGLLYLAGEMYLLGLLLAALATWPRPATTARRFGRVRWAHVPVLVVLVLWAANPYLGLRTTSSFTMFSSIRTEGSAPNHLFLPALRLVDWQEDLVVIEEVSDPELGEIGDGDVAMPLMGLRRLATNDPALVVEGTLRGDPVTFGPGPDQTTLQPLTGWRHKFLHFRPVGISDQPFCHNS